MKSVFSSRATWRGSLSILSLVMVALSATAVHAQTGAAPLSNASPVLQDFSKLVQDQSLPESERQQYIALLGQWGTAQVRPALLAALADPLPTIRASAARALGWKDNTDAVGPLRQRLEAPGEPAAVRVAVLEALGKIGDSSSRAAVLSVINDPDAAVRGAALWGLTFEALGSSSDRVALLRQMAADTALDPFMRSQAIQGLGSIRDTGSADLLLRILEREPASPMPPATESPTENEVMIIRYRQARDVRAWAARTLWVIDAKAAVPLLVKTADDPDDFFLRLISVVALGSWKSPEAVPVLVKRLNDSFDRTRIAALWAIGEIGDRSTVDPVLARLSDKVLDVRVQAVTTLGELGDGRVRPQLVALQQQDPNARIQEAVDKALSQLSR